MQRHRKLVRTKVEWCTTGAIHATTGEGYIAVNVGDESNPIKPNGETTRPKNETKKTAQSVN